MIAGNQDEGIWIDGKAAQKNNIQNNLIGLRSPDDKDGLGNGDNGILIEGAAHNTVGGPTALDENFIAANGGRGVVILAGKTADNPDGATDNTVQLNYIGTNIAFGKDLGNKRDGVMIAAASSNHIIDNWVSGNGERMEFLSSAQRRQKTTSNKTLWAAEAARSRIVRSSHSRTVGEPRGWERCAHRRRQGNHHQG